MCLPSVKVRLLDMENIIPSERSGVVCAAAKYDHDQMSSGIKRSQVKARNAVGPAADSCEILCNQRNKIEDVILVGVSD